EQSCFLVPNSSLTDAQLFFVDQARPQKQGQLAMALDWVSSILQIVLVNAVLSGDNAMVIALAAHRLPAAQRRQAMLWGSGLAIVMRLLLTFVVSTLLLVPEVAREAMALAWQEPVGMHSLMCLDQRYSPYPLFPRPST